MNNHLVTQKLYNIVTEIQGNYARIIDIYSKNIEPISDDVMYIHLYVNMSFLLYIILKIYLFYLNLKLNINTFF